MSENPDNITYEGLGPQHKIAGTTLDQRYLIPSGGMLRFVERETPATTAVRVLQQYQWSAEEGKHDWYDIPMVVE